MHKIAHPYQWAPQTRESSNWGLGALATALTSMPRL